MNSPRIFVSAVVGLLSMTGGALAHAHLRSATPAVNATVSMAPSELDLNFSEGLDLAFTGADVIGPDKKAVATGRASLQAGGDTTLVVPVAPPLGAGTYTVKWHALAKDGHKTGGSYTFTVKP